MIIFPAIDIRGGKCVRLTEGDFNQEIIYGDDPVVMAQKWAGQGAEFLHVVDLDGALAGSPVNLEIIARIVKAIPVPVQVGGGIRDEEKVRILLNLGVRRVILGSVAVKNPKLVEQLCRMYGDKIAVGIDARNGMVAVEGWAKAGNITAVELAKKMADSGVSRIIYTDISRDGKLAGVGVDETVSIAKAAGIPVIASGGVKDMDDVKAVMAATNQGLEGVIVGKALYAGTLELNKAISYVKEVEGYAN